MPIHPKTIQNDDPPPVPHSNEKKYEAPFPFRANEVHIDDEFAIVHTYNINRHNMKP